MAREGLVLSPRGPNGGFLLARAPAKITLLERHYGNTTVEEMAKASRSGTRCLFPVAVPKSA
ncbi:MAG: hypothetical protein O2819_05555 [Planctomycetota bacterium]|nr:hypothetical protein [Planctomycetota bacterium]MDA1106346.1 hypothetical protein [Planctomycetota bacterium]